MAVTRPLKEGSVTTYQQKVAAGFPDILASEVDADLDTIYAAWNGGVATANLVDGSVTTPKLAAAPNGVATANLNDLSVSTAKLAANAVTAAKMAVGGSLRLRSVSAALSGNVNATNTETSLLQIPSVVFSGGLVLFFVPCYGLVNLADTAVQGAQLKLYVGGTLIASAQFAAQPITATLGLSQQVTYWLFQSWPSSPQTNTVQVNFVRTGGTSTWQIQAGTLHVVEFV
jgi:hypothetical protein